MAEKDFNDVLDEILLSEERAHEKSYEEGFKVGQSRGNPEGFHLGYHRGAEIGKELGYYLGVITGYLSEDCTPQPTEKIKAQLLKVKELIDTFPRTNSEDHDILNLLETIRAQYKKACALLKINSNNPYLESVSF